jgi:rubrerythrin/DNA-directed RNA polymerase subunit RPC12/RpoP
MSLYINNSRKEDEMVTSPKVQYACDHCGAEADMILEGFESVEDVIKKKKGMICKNCGKEIETFIRVKKPFACEHCGAEADMTLEGFEKVEDVIKREKKLSCKTCGKDISWTVREDLKAIEIAMKAEKGASQFYSKAAKMTKNPKGKDMFQQLSEFEMNHYNRLKELSQSLQEKGEWMLYSGISLKKKSIPLKMDKLKGKEQLTDMDALKIAIKEEKKAQAYYRSMAELTKDPRGRDMYKRLVDEEALHEKVLNDQYYSIHNTGIWSWGD